MLRYKKTALLFFIAGEQFFWVFQISFSMNTDELLEKMRKLIEPHYKKLDNLEQGQARIKTTVEAFAAGQQDIRQQMAAKHGVERLEKGQGDINKSNDPRWRRRCETREEGEQPREAD